MSESRRCSIESLETRALFAAAGIHIVDVPMLITPTLVGAGTPVSGLSGVTLKNGTLAITGTHKADTITITRQADGFVRVSQPLESFSVKDTNGQIKFAVKANSTIGVSATELNQDDVYVVRVGNASYAIKTSGVDKIVINGGDGNDTIRIGKNVRTQTTVNGGAGNDLLAAGRKNDILNGNAGDDTLISSFDATIFTRYRGGDGTDRLFADPQSGTVGALNSIEELLVTVKPT